MSETEKSPCIKNKERLRLLPIKLHYLFLYGASGGVIPYLPVLGKHLGLSATSVGLVYTVQPIAILISKPAFGALTDHLRNFKSVMISLLLVQCLANLSVLLIEPIPKHTIDNVFEVQCNGTKLEISASSQYNKSCILDLMKNMSCSFKFDRCMNDDECVKSCNQSNQYITGQLVRNERSVYHWEDNAIPLSLEIKIPHYYKYERNIKPYILQIAQDESNVSSPCDCGNSIWKTENCSRNLKPCLSPEYNQEKNVYCTYQFWTYTILVVIGGASAASLFTLTDAACYEILENRPDLYGNQRLWATTSWGIITLLTGYLNDLFTDENSGIDYGPGFYLMSILLLIDLLLLGCMKLPKSKFSSSIMRDVKKIFASSEIVAFAVAVFISGAMSGLLWSYQFWYFEGLGASQLLLGLMIAVQCLLAEVPFFLISGCMIRTFGHFFCLVGTFAANSLRYILYYFIQNPWYALPVELLHGQTYANFYATLTSFANQKAPHGTEATMMGVFGGIFEGLGVGVGSFLSGIGFDHLGGRNTFLVAGLVSAVAAVAFVFVKFAVDWPVQVLQIQQESSASNDKRRFRASSSYQQSNGF